IVREDDVEVRGQSIDEFGLGRDASPPGSERRTPQRGDHPLGVLGDRGDDEHVNRPRRRHSPAPAEPPMRGSATRAMPSAFTTGHAAVNWGRSVGGNPYSAARWSGDAGARWSASRKSSMWFRTPSLRMRFVRCTSTVFTLMESRSAMSLLVYAPAT